MTDKDELSSLRRSETEAPLVRSPEKVASNRPLSELNFPFRRSNSSLSALFATTSGSLAPKRASTPVFSRSPVSHPAEPSFAPLREAGGPASNEHSDLIVRSFAPHIALLPSTDTEELLAQKGFAGGLLDLLRPFGENVSGKVTIRDSVGSSRSCDNFAVHFKRLKDGLESPRISKEEERSTQNINGYLDQLLPQSSARLRTGGDVNYVDEIVEKHLSYSDLQDSPETENKADGAPEKQPHDRHSSPFHLLYLRRLLSGLPVSPHETFSQPVACVLAISSRSSDPIDELRNLYALTRTGDERLPDWASNEYLRYYVLVHDEGHDDSQRSTSIFEQMKRHFGLHCHLLRLRSSQCVPSDDDCVRLPICEWLSAAEELSEIQKREGLDDMEDTGPCLYESDNSAVKSFVRELVTQSVIPIMERSCSTWNDQIVSRRRGISGRFLSLSKKWTPFGSNRNSSSTFGIGGGSGNTSPTNSGTNYDPQNGTYRSDAPEALMRRLADHAFMLRDFKLALIVYEMLRTDYTNDKAWKYYAGACEMSAITSLIINPSLPSTKSRIDPASVESMLEVATNSYITRCASPFAALRCLAVSLELLYLRGGQAVDEAAHWACRILDLDLVGSVGQTLFTERIATLFQSRTGTGSGQWGARKRKAAFWSLQATQMWLHIGRPSQAEASLREVWKLYEVGQQSTPSFAFEGMKVYLSELRDELLAREDSGEMGTIEDDDLASDLVAETDMTLTTMGPRSITEEVSETLDVKSKRKSMIEPSPGAEKPDIRTHRKTGSLIGFSTAPTSDPLGVVNRGGDGGRRSPGP